MIFRDDWEMFCFCFFVWNKNVKLYFENFVIYIYYNFDRYIYNIYIYIYIYNITLLNLKNVFYYAYK